MMTNRFYQKSKFIVNILWGIVLAIDFVGAFSVLAGESVHALPETQIAIPSNSNIRFTWVVPPATGTEVLSGKYLKLKDEIQFIVDCDGNPWISTDRRTIIVPTKKLAFELSESFQQIVPLMNGGLLITTLRSVGTIGLSENFQRGESGFALVPFQPFTNLPRIGARLFPGDGQTVFCVTDEPNGGSTVYKLAPEKDSKGVEEVRRWVKLFATDERVSCVAGNAYVVWIAIGKSVFTYKADSGRLESFAVAPSEIRQLVRLIDGLYCTTKDHVGYVGGIRQIFFLRTPYPFIAGSFDNRLFILFPNTMGVGVLENLKAFFDLEYKQILH